MTSQHTSQHSPRRRWRRLIGASGMLLLTIATFAGILAAGAVVTERSLHQRVPSTSAQASRTAYTEPEGPAGNTIPQQRRLVVAFVVGKSGTIASTTGPRSSACAAGLWSSHPPACSTDSTPPATGRASAPSKPAAPPCTGCAAAGTSKTAP